MAFDNLVSLLLIAGQRTGRTEMADSGCSVEAAGGTVIKGRTPELNYKQWLVLIFLIIEGKLSSFKLQGSPRGDEQHPCQHPINVGQRIRQYTLAQHARFFQDILAHPGFRAGYQCAEGGGHEFYSFRARARERARAH